MNFPFLSEGHHRVNVRQYREPLLAPDEATRLRTALDRWRCTAGLCLFTAALMAAVLGSELINKFSSSATSVSSVVKKSEVPR